MLATTAVGKVTIKAFASGASSRLAGSCAQRSSGILTEREESFSSFLRAGSRLRHEYGPRLHWATGACWLAATRLTARGSARGTERQNSRAKWTKRRGAISHRADGDRPGRAVTCLVKRRVKLPKSKPTRLRRREAQGTLSTTRYEARKGCVTRQHWFGTPDNCENYDCQYGRS
jgi:hypothetical protein